LTGCAALAAGLDRGEQRGHGDAQNRPSAFANGRSCRHQVLWGHYA